MTILESLYFRLIITKASKISYKTQSIQYKDGFTGEEHEYSPSFTITYSNGFTEHVEVQPASEQKPLTKYLYAQNHLVNWRMINSEELKAIGCEDNKTPNWW